MPDIDTLSAEDLIRMTTELAAAYLSNNNLAASQLPEVLKTIHGSLTALNTPLSEAEAAPPTPAVPIKKSVTPRLPRLPRGRQEAEDAEATFANGLQPVTGRLPEALGLACRLSDGGA